MKRKSADYTVAATSIDTGGNDGPLLFGMEKEHAQKMEEKYDKQYERQAIEWIEAFTGEELGDFQTSLKSGIVLCKLANAIRPDIIKVVNVKPLALLERENIKAFLRACEELGVEKDELFDVSDLTEKKSLNAVLTTIYGLGRAVQTLKDYNGPKLGVKYTITLEQKQQRLVRKETERQIEAEKWGRVAEDQKRRRLSLERKKTERTIAREEKEEENMNRRATRKGRTVKTKKKDRHVSISPVRYGMDLEIQLKMEGKHGNEAELESSAMDWMEQMTGVDIDDFYLSLKSGVVLCQLINVIEPGIVPKIHDKDVPLFHRENIQLYLDACRKLGIPGFELFTVNDLYEKKMLSSVVTNIYAVARVAHEKMKASAANPARGSTRPQLGTTSLVVRGGKSMIIKEPNLMPIESAGHRSPLLEGNEKAKSKCCCVIL